MATFTLLTRSFEVKESSKKFLESYLSRVETYIRKHSLDIQLSEDLSERLQEKLSELESAWEITEKSVVSVVNNLGEPEDIFRDILDTNPAPAASRITKADVKDFFRREFHRNGKDGIILGVCSGLAETFEINAIWIRLLFISLIPAYGFVIIIYLILWVLLPDISRSSPNIWGKTDIGKQAEGVSEDIERVAKNAEYKVRSYAESHSDSTLVRFFSGILNIGITLARAFAKIILFLVLGGIALGVFWAGIGVISLAGFASARPIIDNQAIFSTIPNWLPTVALACGIAGIILSIIIGSRALGRGIGGGWLVLCCFAVLWVGVFSAVQTGTTVLAGLQNTYSTGSTTDLSVASGTTLSIDAGDVSGIRFSRNHFLNFNISSPAISILASKDDKIHVEVISTIRTTDASRANEILSKANPTAVILLDNNLSLTIPNGKDFSEVVPLSILSREIKISLPKSVKARLSGSYSTLHNAGLLGETSPSMQNRGIHFCGDLIRFYDISLDRFICHSDSLIEKSIFREREAFLRDQDADFFSKDADGWVRIKGIEHSGSGITIVTWRDDGETDHRLRVEFASTENNDGEPVVVKKEPIALDESTSKENSEKISSWSTSVKEEKKGKILKK